MKFDFKLTTTEIRALRAIGQGNEQSIGRISEATDILYPVMSRAISSLSKKGFLRVSRRGLTRQVSLSDAKHAQLFKRLLSEFSHMNFEKILTGSSMEVLSHITDAPLKRKEIEEQSCLTAKTVKVALKRLKEFGVVFVKEGFTYVLNRRFSLLGEFVEEFRRYYNQRLAEDFSADSVIIWQVGKEFLIKTRSSKEYESFFLTGISAFHQYGIKLFLPDYDYYFHSPYKTKLGVEDILLHAIIADPNGTRTILSALLLWKKNDRMNVKYLLEEAKKYRVDDVVYALIDYLNSEGRTKPGYFPTWAEYLAKAEEYGLR